MNADIFNALELLEKEGIPQSYMIEKIEQALTSAFKKEYGPTALMRVDMDMTKKKIKAYLQKEVVEEVENPQCQISLEDAKAISRRYTLGKMVELADADEIYNHPLHPYSQSLLSAVPVPDPRIARANQRIVLNGDIPSPLNAPGGCPFHTRCRHATEVCAHSQPPFEEVEPGRFVACHRVREIN